MLGDCSKGIFNAIIIFDMSRWSRDPEKSRYGLAILKKNGIRLFIQTQEYNLNNPETNLIVGILNEINQFNVTLQIKKSMLSKIEVAKRGFPVTGKGPWGRRLVHNDRKREAEWEIIPERLSKN